MDASEKASPEAQAAVATLARAISDPEQRKAFVADPRGALGEAYQHVPERLLEGISRMSEDELVVISNHCEALVAAGLYVELPGGGRLCFF